MASVVAIQKLFSNWHKHAMDSVDGDYLRTEETKTEGWGTR